MNEQKCPKCGNKKAVNEFYIDRTRPNGRATYCKGCSREIVREYNKNNKERIKERRKKYNYAYRKTNKQKNMIKAKDDDLLWGGIEEATEKRCPKCGETKPVIEFHRDNSRRGGRSVICKLCVKKYDATRKEEKAEYMKKYRATHLQEYRQYAKDSRERNKIRNANIGKSQ